MSYTQSEDELAQLQKLSNEYEPAVTVRMLRRQERRSVDLREGPFSERTPVESSHHHRVRQRRPKLQNKDCCNDIIGSICIHMVLIAV